MCYFVTLTELGYATHATLANGLPSGALPADDYHVSLEGRQVPALRLEVDNLFTGNGKPYVLARYGSGPFSLHHG